MSDIGFRKSSLNAGFTQVFNVVTDDVALNDGTYRTYVVMLSFAWQKPHLWTGQESLAKVRGVSSRTIREHISELETVGLITVERRGKGLTNRYWIEDPFEISRYQKSPQEGVTGRSLPVGQEEVFRGDRKKSSAKEDEVEEDEGEQERPTPRGGVTRINTAPQHSRRNTRRGRSRGRIHAEPDPGGLSEDDLRERREEDARNSERPPRRKRGESDRWSRWNTRAEADWRGADFTGYFIAKLRSERGIWESADVNREALTGNIAEWLADGVPPATIKEAIDIFAKKRPVKNKSAWRVFIGMRKELFDKATKSTSADESRFDGWPREKRRAYWEGRLEEYEAGTYIPS